MSDKIQVMTYKELLEAIQELPSDLLECPVYLVTLTGKLLPVTNTVFSEELDSRDTNSTTKQRLQILQDNSNVELFPVLHQEIDTHTAMEEEL